MSSGAIDRIATAVNTSPMSSPQGVAPFATPDQYNRKRSLPESGDGPNSYPIAFSVSGSSLYSESASSQGSAGASSIFSSPLAIGSMPFGSPEASRDMQHLSPGYDASPEHHYENLLRTPVYETRPDLKRRKTAPADMSPHKSPIKRSPERRGTGKDGAEVWPEHVEAAFFSALHIVPKLGRRKVLVNGKPCGRNELIADYIYRKTNIMRTRKQVSSHIQVLKNMKRDDPDFMKLVSEPQDGVDDTFSPEMIAAFGGGITACTNSPSAVASAPMSHTYSDGLLAPVPAGPAMLYRSNSCGPSPLLSPALSDCSSIGSSLPSPFLNGSPTSSALIAQMKDMHFPFPPQPEGRSTNLPIAPSHFCMWATSQTSDDMHVYAKMEKDSLNTPPTRTVYLEDIPMSETRFPGVSQLHERAACQFLHVKMNMMMPRLEDGVVLDTSHIQLLLTAETDQQLSVVTTFYSFNSELLNVKEALGAPTRITPAVCHASQSASSSPASLESPVTPASANNSPVSMRHKYSYEAPFANDFWSIFLSAGESSNLARSPADRISSGAAINGLSAVQEFYVPFDEGVPAAEGEAAFGKASTLGDVVLVVVYEFYSDESAPGLPMNPHRCEVSYLSSRDYPATQHLQSPSRPNAPRRPSCLSYESMPELEPSGLVDVKPTVVPEIQLDSSLPQGNNLRPGRSPVKPSLSLNIPMPGLSLPGQTPPITPWPQMIQTPNCPPPVQAPNAHGRHRLGQAWAVTAGEWNLDSPALEGYASNMIASSAAMHSMNNDHLSAAPVGNAMNWLTKDAIAAGTPVLPNFPRHDFAHGTPFLGPAAHGSQPYMESDYFGTVGAEEKPFA